MRNNNSNNHNSCDNEPSTNYLLDDLRLDNQQLNTDEVVVEQHSNQSIPSTNISALQTVTSAILAITPLSLSVTPWGVLCGTLAIEAGMNSQQAMLMSLIVFAGAVQISGISIIGSGGGWLSLFNSTTMISMRHILYSASFKEEISKLPFLKRVIFAFLLTDEMFVVAKANQLKTGRFSYLYAVSAGLTFYMVWNLATLIGVFSANLIPNIDELGFDFAIAATFIAMVVPMIKDKVMLVAVFLSASTALLLAYFHVGQGLIIAALIGMIVGAILKRKGELN